MAEQGVLLENNKDKAQVILEPSFGAYGTDQRDTTTGLPGIGLALAHGTGRHEYGQLDSLNFSQTNRQDAVVKAVAVRLRGEDRAPGVGIRHAPQRPGRCATTSSSAPAPTA